MKIVGTASTTINIHVTKLMATALSRQYHKIFKTCDFKRHMCQITLANDTCRWAWS